MNRAYLTSRPNTVYGVRHEARQVDWIWLAYSESYVGEQEELTTRIRHSVVLDFEWQIETISDLKRFQFSVGMKSLDNHRLPENIKRQIQQLFDDVSIGGRTDPIEESQRLKL